MSDEKGKYNVRGDSLKTWFVSVKIQEMIKAEELSKQNTEYQLNFTSLRWTTR